MKFIKVKKEINRISNIDDPVLCQKEIKILDKKVNSPSITLINRNNYYDLWVIENIYDPEIKRSTKKTIEKIGKLSFEDYESNKKEIECFREKGEIEQLKKIIIKIKNKESE